MNEFRIQQRLLSYTGRLSKRSTDTVDLVVIHCTELPDLDTAREFGERIIYPESRTGNSGHYYIERNGCVEQWVPDDAVAHHARGYNERSIGIELDNLGRFPDWFNSGNQVMKQAYTAGQIKNLLALLHSLQQRLPELRWISGHAVLDTSLLPASDNPDRRVRRKLDPGPQFPWDRVLKAASLEWFDPSDQNRSE